MNRDGIWRIVEDRDWPPLERRMTLSHQQFQIMRLIITEDLTAKQIAARLRTKVKCVTKQMERMFEKLNVRSRTALAVRVLGEHYLMKMESRGS